MKGTFFLGHKRLLVFIALAVIVAIAAPTAVYVNSNNAERAAEQERLDNIQKELDKIDAQLSNGNPEEVADAWTQLVSNANTEQYRDFAEKHGGFPTEFELNRLWDMRTSLEEYGMTGLPSEYLRAYNESGLDETSVEIDIEDYGIHANAGDSDRYYSYIYLKFDSEQCKGLSLDELVALAGFTNQTEDGVAYQQYASSGNTDLQYRYDFQFAPTTMGGEDALLVAVSRTERENDSPTEMILYCMQLNGRNAEDVISQLVLYCENSGWSGFGLNLEFILLSLAEKEPIDAGQFDSEPHLEFTFDEPAVEQDDTGGSQDSISGDSSKKDELLVNEDGKSMYRVYACSDSFDFSGSYEGTGNFIVRILDSNQNHYSLVANEIGSYAVDTSVPVQEGNMYYIVIECSYGTWNLQWTGTYGGA
ncbi:hypothetical protein H6A07_03660 [Olsenella uli]|uniref:hypothetical protein n=1 Tax=Olsenella uli TaxID=133926 RepID=UPI00195AD13F|nr:hypothetical protein [Olsenella uli]MBM6675841.1 hypothetical protein [Olsenella uli]